MSVLILLKNNKKCFPLRDLLRPWAFRDRIFIFKTRTYSLEHPKEMKLCISMTYAFVGKSFEMQIVVVW